MPRTSAELLGKEDEMQFRLAHLLVAITIFAIALGLTFISPPAVGFPILAILLPTAPAIWITGIIHARGGLRAFFVGGLSAGAVPCLFAFYFFNSSFADVWNRWLFQYQW